MTALDLKLVRIQQSRVETIFDVREQQMNRLVHDLRVVLRFGFVGTLVDFLG